MAKGIAISLATKCQLLFGLAVLVIIGGVLAVPWQRMEQLAGQQNVKAARMLADAAFREVHEGGGSSKVQRVKVQKGATEAAGEGAATQGAGATSADTWGDVALVDLAVIPNRGL